jgi:tRNA A37 N6-isopentenylltransferase MiaA
LGAVGYFEVTEYLAGHLPSGRKLREGLLGLRDEIELATRQLVKRQRTWFKSQKHRKDFKLPDDEKNLLAELVNFYEQ